MKLKTEWKTQRTITKQIIKGKNFLQLLTVRLSLSLESKEVVLKLKAQQLKSMSENTIRF